MNVYLGDNSSVFTEVNLSNARMVLKLNMQCEFNPDFTKK